MSLDIEPNQTRSHEIRDQPNEVLRDSSLGGRSRYTGSSQLEPCTLSGATGPEDSQQVSGGNHGESVFPVAISQITTDRRGDIVPGIELKIVLTRSIVTRPDLLFPAALCPNIHRSGWTVRHGDIIETEFVGAIFEGLVLVVDASVVRGVEEDGGVGLRETSVTCLCLIAASVEVGLIATFEMNCVVVWRHFATLED